MLNKRVFKIDDNSSQVGRIVGKKPKLAASKAFSYIIRNMGDNYVNGNDIPFTIVECTKGSKNKEYNYIGYRKEMDESLVINCSDKGVIICKYVNVIKKECKPIIAKRSNTIEPVTPTIIAELPNVMEPATPIIIAELSNTIEPVKEYEPIITTSIIKILDYIKMMCNNFTYVLLQYYKNFFY